MTELITANSKEADRSRDQGGQSEAHRRIEGERHRAIAGTACQKQPIVDDRQHYGRRQADGYPIEGIVGDKRQELIRDHSPGSPSASLEV